MKILLVADLHLRHDRPICRMDEDWIESQKTDLENIARVVKDRKCDEVWLLGDIFHRPVEPPEVVNMAINGIHQFHVPTYAICGNHDLEHHSLKNWSRSSISNLFTSGNLHVIEDRTQDLDITAYDFGTEAEVEDIADDIVLTHQLVFPKEVMNFGNGKVPEELQRQFPNAKVVLMGDYHEGWDNNLNGQIQCMVGCMNIQSGKLKDYKPRVCIFDTGTYSIESVYLPQDHVKITTDHLVEAKKRDERLEKLAESFDKVESVEFDFIGNLKELSSTNNKVKELVTELIDTLNKEQE